MQNYLSNEDMEAFQPLEGGYLDSNELDTHLYAAASSVGPAAAEADSFYGNPITARADYDRAFASLGGGNAGEIAPAWLRGNITREEAEAILARDRRTGAFLVRVKEPNRQWALSVCNNGEFVHHLVQRDPRTDVFSVNGSPCPANCASIVHLVKLLRTPAFAQSWSVLEQPLLHPVGH
jgi:hypothetical protein